MSDSTLVAEAEPAPAPGWARGYILALALVAAATFGGVLVSQWTGVPNASLVFVLPVVIVAVSFGWGAALVAAVAGTVCFNFFLIAPRYSLRVDDPSNAWSLALLLLVAAIVSAVAAQSRRRAVEAVLYADQYQVLQGLGRSLLAAGDRAAIVDAAVLALGRMFQAPATILLAESDTAELKIAAALPADSVAALDMDAARWAIASRVPTRAGGYPVEGARFDFWPIRTRSRMQIAVGVSLPAERHAGARAPDRLVEIVSGYLAVALERERYAAQALEARIDTERQRLHADLLAAVSHDLRTPLSTILVTLQSLQKFGDQHSPGARDQLLALAEVETRRLNGLVGNLLDMSRLDAGAVTVKTAAVELADLVAAAVAHAWPALEGHPLIQEVTGLGAVRADHVLAETALAHVLENAAKYSAPGAPIVIRRASAEGMGAIEVLDQGPGFPEPIEPLFEKFARGHEGDGRPPGTGLGLAIARGLLTAMGGGIEAENRAGGAGALVRVRLPLVERQDRSA